MPSHGDRGIFPVVDASNKSNMLAAMRDHDIAVSNVEFFPILPMGNVADFRTGLALGAELGAARAVCHIHDTDQARAVDALGQLADDAAGFGLSIGLEFMGITPGCTSLHQAAWFVDQVSRPNVGIAVDMLHLVRTGGTATDVAGLDSRYFSYAQICDGQGSGASSDYMGEALNRQKPGDGDFPMQAIIEALPLSCALDVEIPNFALFEQGQSTEAWAIEAVAKCRALISQSHPSH